MWVDRPIEALVPEAPPRTMTSYFPRVGFKTAEGGFCVGTVFSGGSRHKKMKMKYGKGYELKRKEESL